MGHANGGVQPTREGDSVEAMGNDFGGLAAAAVGGGIVFFVVLLAIIVGVVALEIWVVYTIIWRAVRRGMREYHHGSTPPNGQSKSRALYPPSNW